MTKLHLGCGQRYLHDYVNIDFPLDEHTVQRETVADQYADILSLSYPSGSIDEIRLHHVFEHFTRPVSCALISGWYIWLASKGRIHIEVPDFYRTAAVLLNPFKSFHQKAVAERHLFGSHEARWAAHCEGYSSKTLTSFIKMFGFKVQHIRKNAWRGTYNLEVIARKENASLTREDLSNSAKSYLENFLLDRSESELRLLDTWMNMYRKQVDILLGSRG